MTLTIVPKTPWKRGGKRNQPERALHSTVARYLDQSLPSDTYWFPIPMGLRAHDERYAAMMKQTGQIKAGVPDLCIVHRGRAIFIELKAGKNELTDSQKDAQKQILLAGAVTAIARSLGDVEAFLRMLMPMKGKVQ